MISEYREEPGGQASPIYDPQQAIELVQKQLQLSPLRIFGVLFPLWTIEVTEIQEYGQPYMLIEKHIERGIATTGLNTIQALADFFALDSRQVEQVVTFLESIGHVLRADGMLYLTPTGIRSVTDGKRYDASQRKRYLYFDGFRLTPLPAVYYSDVPLLSEEEAEALVSSSAQSVCPLRRLFPFKTWNSQTLADLLQRPDRAGYAITDDVTGLVPLAVSVSYLPMYIMEVRTQAASYFAVYSRIAERHDKFFEGLINSCIEIAALF